MQEKFKEKARKMQGCKVFPLSLHPCTLLWSFGTKFAIGSNYF
jgi:hypothetical protein